MIKYIGSKRALVPTILRVIESFTGAESVVDFFSGTSRVGHALKQRGYRVIANDLMTYAHTLGLCYVQADLDDVLDDAERLLAEFRRLPGKPGYFTETFCVRSRFFQPKNGERIDAIRDAIAARGLEPELEAVLLVALMEAADRVDSTTGLQMAYLKQWAPRASNDLELRMPAVLPRPAAGKGAAHQLEACDAADRLTADVAFIDPPYNQHSYLGNYHVWESLVRWDKPEVYGIACKRIDCRERKSDFNSRKKAHDKLRDFLDRVRCPHLVVSFNNEGYIAQRDMESMLARHGRVITLEQDYKRYVGAQIGIHNLKGERVGKVSHLRNKELFYVVVPHDAPENLEATLRQQREQLLFG
ncbi:MAG: DNA adenine methylase [Phycisphaeraceae bacterium]|nr:DNA adenine methylase [Phycisphaeraceae bacterium]MCB9847210.1 DNA adenine methylase [Phycisphaeraceae bacterium]